MPFDFKPLNLNGLLLITPRVYRDDRGFFVETYKTEDFATAGINDVFVQDNHSKSSKGVIRGLHYQLPPNAQSKLVRCLQGRIFDVAVDIRHNSSTYGKWAGAELTAEGCEMLYIPKGFAHGFAVLSDTAEITYKCGAQYAPECERGIIWNDKNINIKWPFNEPLLSGKDSVLPYLEEAELQPINR